MKYVSEEDLRAHLINDGCDDGCGYLDERDIHSLPWRELDEDEKGKVGQFAKWVAIEIFDELWEYNKDAFSELACRKLAKLGIVRAKDDEWELVEPQEGSDK